MKEGEGRLNVAFPNGQFDTLQFDDFFIQEGMEVVGLWMIHYFRGINLVLIFIYYFLVREKHYTFAT